jgi:excisionase family DNA binding protein
MNKYPPLSFFLQLQESIHELTAAVNGLKTAFENGTDTDGKPLGITEAAHYLNVSKPTLYSLTSKREIPHLKRGQKLYFIKADLDQWLQCHRQCAVQGRKEVL